MASRSGRLTRRGTVCRVIDAARGLSASAVAERLARGEVNRLPASHTRTYGQIVRANVLTRFNALLGAMLAIIVVVGPFQDALFGFVLFANAAVGIVQEVRAKRTLERLTVLTGESDPVGKAPGDAVRSGSFAVAGAGRYRATAIGSDVYAVRLAEEARS